MNLQMHTQPSPGSTGANMWPTHCMHDLFSLPLTSFAQGLFDSGSGHPFVFSIFLQLHQGGGGDKTTHNSEVESTRQAHGSA